MPDDHPTYRTPPEIARRLGVGPEKVLAWIRSGELAAVNLATTRHGRPRWAIAPEALDLFLAARQNHPPPHRTRRRRALPANIIKYF
jgi:excisionase family DNA binding protein